MYLYVYRSLIVKAWHDMEMVSMLLALCGGNPAVTGGFPSQKDNNDGSPHKGTVLWSFNAFFVVSPNELLNKLSSC